MIRIMDAGRTPPEEILARTEERRDVSAAVSAIIETVRREGDRALRRYALELDHAQVEDLEVPPDRLDRALADLDGALRAVLEEAAENIRDFHRRQMRASLVAAERPGVVLGQKLTPIARVGLYIPGGTAAYPSTVLMNAIPAKIAGCREIVMVSPPTCGGDVNPVILAAARIAGVDRVFRCGGAQAVAALAWGTETVPRVDKITGPGSVFVAEAKRQVFGQVGIDMIAGPSEILVLADGKTDPKWAAADLLSQAEHDVLASAVLVTDSRELAEAVRAEIEVQLEVLPRKDIARRSIEDNGKIIVTDSLDKAVEAVNRIAPEHLELCVDGPFALLPRIKNAGSIFMGRSTPEALGDYFAGPNHTLPTSGTARFSSPLGVDDFMKRSSFLYYDRTALNGCAEKVADFARREGLEGHARSALSRREGFESPDCPSGG